MFYVGTIDKVPLVVVKSGIGKVNAAIATALLIQLYEPEYVVSCGSAGGFHKDLQVGDIVISKEVQYHDVDATAFGYAYGQIPQQPLTYEAAPMLIDLAVTVARQVTTVNVMEGLMASGDSFISEGERVAFVTSKFPDLLAADMVAAAIGQTCELFGVPFVIIRSLSDIAGKDIEGSYDPFSHQASSHSASVIQSMLNKF